MLSTLAQVTTTYVSVLLAAIAAYLVFLWTARANIDADIQRQGAEFKEAIALAHVLDVPIPYMDFFLLQEYRAKYPKDSQAGVLHRIATEIQLGSLPWPPDAGNHPTADAVLRIAARGNMPGPLAGRVAAWTMQQSLAALLVIPRPSGSSARDPAARRGLYPSTEKLLFPDGPLGVRSWLKRYAIATETVTGLSVMTREALLQDIEAFANSSPELAGFFGRTDYRRWWARVERVGQSLAPQAAHVASLATLRETFEVTKRLRSRRWLVALLGAAVGLGIVTPLAGLAIRPEGPVPAAFSVSLLLATVWLCAGVGWLLYRDIARPAEADAGVVQYLQPLLREVRTARQVGSKQVTVRLEPLNELLAERQLDQRASRDVAVFERLQRAVSASNAASEQVAGMVILQFQENATLQAHNKLGGGGSVLPVLEVFDEATFDRVMSAQGPGSGLVVEANHGPVSTTLLALELPDSEDKMKVVAGHLRGIAQAITKEPEYAEYVTARRRLESELAAAEKWLDKRVRY